MTPSRRPAARRRRTTLATAPSPLRPGAPRERAARMSAHDASQSTQEQATESWCRAVVGVSGLLYLLLPGCACATEPHRSARSSHVLFQVGRVVSVGVCACGEGPVRRKSCAVPIDSFIISRNLPTAHTPVLAFVVYTRQRDSGVLRACGGRCACSLPACMPACLPAGRVHRSFTPLIAPAAV